MEAQTKTIPYKIQPWAHQLEGIERGKANNIFALFFEMGTGKSLTAINILRWRYLEHRKILPTLILCPLIVVENWKREIEANAGHAVIDSMQCLTGDFKNRRKQLDTPGKQIFITNLDTINTKLWEFISGRTWAILLIDEAHKFKSPTAKRTKKVISFADRIFYKLILTGSPVLNNAMDIWAQLRILSPEIFPENFYVFRAQYFEDKNASMPTKKYFPNWQPKEKALEELRTIIRRHSMRVLKKNVLDLPPLVKQSVFVELTPEQQKHYDEMESDFITYLNGEACVAEIALTKMLRLQQIVAGIIKTETGAVQRIATEKKGALKELLEDLCPHSKVIVWTNFTDSYDDVREVCAELELKHVEIVGKQNKTKRQTGMDLFNSAQTETCVCLANQSAGGVGIGLQAASYMIYYGKTYNLEHDQQSESRNHRGGSEVHDKVTRIDIVAQNTIDEDITGALRTKQELGEFLLKLKEKYGRENGLGVG